MSNLATIIDFNVKRDEYNKLYIAEEFINSFQSVQTKKSYVFDLKDFFQVESIKFISNIMVKNVKYKLIQDYVSNMVNDGYSKATVKRRIGCLKSFFNYCVDAGIVNNNPFADRRLNRLLKNKLPKNEMFVGTALSVKRIKELYNKIDNSRDLALIKMILRTGLRKEEITTVKGNNFIYNEIKEKWFLYVRGKGRKDRYIEISNDYMEKIKTYKNYGTSRPLFPNKFGNEMSGANVNRILKKYTDIQVHDLRRTFATNLYNKGMDVAMLQKILGHSNISTTMRYIKQADMFNQNISELIDW